MGSLLGSPYFGKLPYNVFFQKRNTPEGRRDPSLAEGMCNSCTVAGPTTSKNVAKFSLRAFRVLALGVQLLVLPGEEACNGLQKVAGELR